MKIKKINIKNMVRVLINTDHVQIMSSQYNDSAASGMQEPTIFIFCGFRQ